MWGILMLYQNLWGKELTLYSHLDWRRHSCSHLASFVDPLTWGSPKGRGLQCLAPLTCWF